MPVSRREFLQLVTAAGMGVVAAPRTYAARSAPEVYTGCLAIDGLGGPGDADSDEGAPLSAMWDEIWPLLIIGAVSIPLGLWVFSRGELYAKKHGKLKRSG